jgi:hypothetical protein
MRKEYREVGENWGWCSRRAPRSCRDVVPNRVSPLVKKLEKNGLARTPITYFTDECESSKWSTVSVSYQR